MRLRMANGNGRRVDDDSTLAMLPESVNVEECEIQEGYEA